MRFRSCYIDFKALKAKVKLMFYNNMEGNTVCYSEFYIQGLKGNVPQLE